VDETAIIEERGGKMRAAKDVQRKVGGTVHKGKIIEKKGTGF